MKKKLYIAPQSEIIELAEPLMDRAPQSFVRVKSGAIDPSNIEFIPKNDKAVNQRWGVIDWGDGEGEQKNFEID